MPPRRYVALSLEIRILAVERRRLADDLNDLSAQRGRELVGGLLHTDVGILGELDLHQLVGAEVVVDGTAHCVGDTMLTNVDRGGQVVGFTAEDGALL